MKKRSTRKREVSIDFLRGVMIILMIITHTIGFLYQGDNEILRFFSYWGGILTFTGFLFASGAASSFVLAKNAKKSPQRMLKSVFRLLTLLCGYYLIAAFAYGGDILDKGGSEILDILVFKSVPEYAEFILPFVIYGFVILLIPEFFMWLIENPVMGWIISFVIFFAGRFLGNIDISDQSIYIKSLSSIFVGHKNWHRFPVFQYFPILMSGMLWASFLIGSRKTKNGEKYRKLYSFIGSILAVLVFLSVGFFNFEVIRFSPNLAFVAQTLGFTMIVLFVSYALKGFVKGFFGKMILFLGKNPLSTFVSHTILLYVLGFLGIGDLSLLNTVFMIFVVLGFSSVVILLSTFSSNKG